MISSGYRLWGVFDGEIGSRMGVIWCVNHCVYPPFNIKFRRNNNTRRYVRGRAVSPQGCRKQHDNNDESR
jgi:hypothetical protein